MTRKYLILAFVVGLLIVGFASVHYYPAHADDGMQDMDSIPTKNDLRSSFFEKRELLVIYATEDSVLSQQYRELLENLSMEKQANSWRSTKIRYKNAAEVTGEDLKRNSLFLVGTVQDHPVLQRFIAHSPFSVTDHQIKIGGKKFPSLNSLLSVGFYPNPLHSKLPYSFLTGTDPQEVFEFFTAKVNEGGQSFYRQNLDYELYHHNKRVVLGDFDSRWNPSSSTFFDFSSKTETVFETEEYRFVHHQNAIGKKQLEELSSRLNSKRARLLAFVDVEKAIPSISYHVYKNMEEKGLITGNTDQSHLDTLNNAVHTIVNEMYDENDIGKENALVLYHAVGSSNSAILRAGLPIYFTDTWQVRGYNYWSARLMESRNALSLRQLFDSEHMAMESPLIRDCLSGTLVDFLITKYGKREFLKMYKNFELEKLNVSKLETDWQVYLRELSKEFPKEKVPTTKLPYLKGFNFAHEGYSIYNGYGSHKATESLLKQKELGSNAMAIVPYSFISDVNTPAPFRFSSSAGNENDEAIVHATFKAKKMGMFTLLKPQVFVGGSWPGGIEMLSETDWKVFFDYYYRWIRHYAFLAEIHQMDALCIGVEFTKASLSHPKAWREMIKRTRGLFTGQLTYAANWGEEFEGIEFWDDLDFIGLNSYYPLSKKNDPTDAELSSKFDTIKTKIDTVYKRFKKPIVFTEIGFRSVDTPWKNPHAEADGSINELAQKRSYEVVFKGIENEPWCQGILWWKFPSYLEYRGTHNNAFTPNNKLAEETVKYWFSK